MNCDKVLDIISLYIDEQLSTKEKKAFEEHIASCNKCKEELDFMQNIINDVNDLNEDKELPKDFHKNLMVKIDNTNAAKKKIENKITKLNKFKKYYTAVAAAFVVVVIFGLIRMNNTDMYTSDGLHFDKQSVVEESTENDKKPLENVKDNPKTFSVTDKSVSTDNDTDVNEREQNQSIKGNKELPQTTKTVPRSIEPSNENSESVNIEFNENNEDNIKAENQQILSMDGKEKNGETKIVKTDKDESNNDTVDEISNAENANNSKSDDYGNNQNESNKKTGVNWYVSSIIVISLIIVLFLPLLIIKNIKNKLNR
ncbi:hypothetical protein SH1V18_24960 [Vallitalea longa]|uniref:Anti-sigma-W factor RsiW n=1 Tax=Vallitalea longa TaxID=2936439 RepID=A0A9W6DEC2_9FIRM|nr:zf-HC2 domain-containing protein [Vallitalea longa]GKX30016.1 hypothetical protein SH1V18_24960 [Vallitalea longa]